MTSRGQLCVVVCGAGPAPQVGRLITLATEAGWSVRVAATPSAASFVDISALEAQTGRPVMTEFRSPTQPRTTGTDDAVIVAPATFNTINKLAAGICDTYALGVVSEAIGAGVPVVILPFVSSALAARLPFRTAVAQLRQEGVIVLSDEGLAHQDPLPFDIALNALDPRPLS